jgi:hypothetical protein
MTQRALRLILESGYNCFAVFGAARVEGDSGPVGSTLVEWLDGGSGEPILIVKAGTQFGPYDVVVRLVGEPPEAQMSRVWEDQVEISLLNAQTLALGDLEDGPSEQLAVPVGVHRLRVCATGRGESAERERMFPDDDDAIDDPLQPLEHFLLEFWPSPFAPAVVISETSRFAQEELSPTEPEWPPEHEPGLEAARRVAADLGRDEGSRNLSGHVGEALMSVEVAGTPVRIFNRVKHASGWPPARGGVLSLDERVGDECSFYGDPPDSDGLAPLLGTLQTRVLELDKPQRIVKSWNWTVGGLRRVRLLDEDSTVIMTFEKVSTRGEDPRTLVTVRHTGVPREWVEDLQRLWAWHVALFAAR